MRLTPLHLAMLGHCYHTATPYAAGEPSIRDSEGVKRVRQNLLDWGLVMPSSDRGLTTTLKGSALLDRLGDVTEQGLPESRAADVEIQFYQLKAMELGWRDTVGAATDIQAVVERLITCLRHSHQFPDAVIHHTAELSYQRECQLTVRVV